MYMQINCRLQLRQSHTHIISPSSASCYILFPFSYWGDMKVLQHDLNYTKFRSISQRVSVCKRTQVPFVNPIVWPYLTRHSARRCECKPELADSLLFSWRQIRGSKIDSCNSGIISWQQEGLSLLSPKPDCMLNISSILSLSSSPCLSFLSLSLLLVLPFFPFLLSSLFCLLLNFSLSTPWLTLLPPSLLSSLMIYPFIRSYLLLTSPSFPHSLSF